MRITYITLNLFYSLLRRSSTYRLPNFVGEALTIFLRVCEPSILLSVGVLIAHSVMLFLDMFQRVFIGSFMAFIHDCPRHLLREQTKLTQSAFLCFGISQGFCLFWQE